MNMEWYYYIFLAPIGIYVLMRILDLIFGRKPNNLGVQDRQLTPMSETPKGVNSYTDYDPQKMEPIPYQGETIQAVAQMVDVLKNLEDYPRITFYEITDNYIWARDISLIWRDRKSVV